MKKERNTAVLYTCGVCNLNCRYCGIDKNPVLKEIDDALGESFKDPDYYFERIKKYFPDRGQLRNVETWGGEPFLKMDRIYPLLHRLIEYYPYFKGMYSSTNFSYEGWKEQVFGLLEQFGDYPYRRFCYCLQLSCDGPEYINDAGRGKGTTQKCLKNFNEFIEEMGQRVPGNVDLTFTIKPTLDIKSFKLLLEKERIIEYYQFFEREFLKKVRQLCYSNVRIVEPVPNIAVPTPATAEDGRLFSKLCRLTREVESENEEKGYFEYYRDITPFSEANGECQRCLSYRSPRGTCGIGNSVVGFLPDNMISSCHEGFIDFVKRYKELAAKSKRTEFGTIEFDKFVGERKTPLCLTDEEYARFEKQMDNLIPMGASARLASLTLQIVLLAMAGQVERKYVNQEEALKAAIFLSEHTAYCVKDNFNINGTAGLIPEGNIKLILNGAMEHIEKEERF